NPDLPSGRHEMSIAGVVRTARVFGPNIELHRTISSQLGKSEINITDRFTNLHNQRTPLCWLLHINIGYPLLEPGQSTFCWRGKETALEGMSQSWYRSENDFKSVPLPRDDHRGDGEFSAYIDPVADDDHNVLCGVINRSRGIGLMIEFSIQEYSRLVVWQHYGPHGSYAAALEPTNAGVEGRPFDEQRGWVQYLEPGQARTFHCKISATNHPEQIGRLLALNRPGHALRKKCEPDT